MRMKCFFEKKCKIFFFNVGNSIKREENMKY